MAFNKQRWSYLMRSAFDRFRPSLQKCPSCNASDFELIKSKMLVTTLVACRQCNLLYRIPQDRPSFNENFYQDAYESGFATKLPTDSELDEYVERGFQGTEKAVDHKLDVLKALDVKAGSRILDFGASWGYVSWQLRQAGFDAEGFEISRPRAEFAKEKLDVSVTADLDSIKGKFDVFFSIHVLEHLPNPKTAFELANRLLKPGGTFIAFTPNGSIACKAAHSKKYHKSWGRLHPLYLSDAFYNNQLPEYPKLLFSADYRKPYPVDEIRKWNRTNNLTLDLSRRELILVYANQTARNLQNSNLEKNGNA